MAAPATINYKRNRRRTRTYDKSDNADQMFAHLAATAAPTGTLLPSFTTTDSADSAWLICDGRTLVKSDFTALYAVLAAGMGPHLIETPTTFDLPDLRGRLPIGAGGGPALAVGETGGSDTATIDVANMPAHSHVVDDPGHGHAFTPTDHSHTITDPAHAHTITDPGHAHDAAETALGVSTPGLGSDGAADATTSSEVTGITIDDATTGITIDDASAGGTVDASATGITLEDAGGGVPLPILPPVIGINWIIRT